MKPSIGILAKKAQCGAPQLLINYRSREHSISDSRVVGILMRRIPRKSQIEPSLACTLKVVLHGLKDLQMYLGDLSSVEHPKHHIAQEGEQRDYQGK